KYHVIAGIACSRKLTSGYCVSQLHKRGQQLRLSTTFAQRAQRAFASTNLPNWGQAAEIAFQTIFPKLVLYLLLQDIEHLKDLALSHGIDIQVSRCKI
ncbi:hypothetical protein, partial [Nostoc sp.]|uniref:hypothetical protein n=1 Tax=Nostoc sp. TaxID=1180 RepID=UPI003B5DEA80